MRWMSEQNPLPFPDPPSAPPTPPAKTALATVPAKSAKRPWWARLLSRLADPWLALNIEPEIPRDREPRQTFDRLLAHFDNNGYLYIHDRTNGRLVRASRFGRGTWGDDPGAVAPPGRRGGRVGGGRLT